MMKNWNRLLAAAITPVLLLGQLSVLPASAETAGTEQEALTAFYKDWKNRYLAQDTYVTEETQYYVYYAEEHYNGGDTSVAVTVSEAHGYGMLITACMAPYDSEAKEIFDGMTRYYLAHLSDIGPHLMSWQQCDNGTALIDGASEGSMTAGEADSATDGDMDIAYAFLLADTLWGSDGTFDYRTLARNVIDDIMEYEVNHTTWTLNLGDWACWEETDSQYYGATRSSDFIMQYMPVFAEAAKDDRWMQVYDSTYAIIDHATKTYGTGLLPDFFIPDNDGGFQPAPAEFLEDVTDGQYAYNSCRIPWRIGMDVLCNQNETAARTIAALNQFVVEQTGGDPDQIMAGYTLDGTATADYSDLCFIAPFLIAAKCGDDAQWESALREYILNYGEDVYYGDTIKMLCLIADAGAWLVPGQSVPPAHGDVNEDAMVDLSDMVELLHFLLGHKTLTQSQLQQGDMQPDGRVNGMDLTLLRQVLVGANEIQ